MATSLPSVRLRSHLLLAMVTSCAAPMPRLSAPVPAARTRGNIDAGVRASDVALGRRICVLSETGSVRCGTRDTPFVDVPLPSRAVALYAGRVATCALLENGQASCWDCPAYVEGQDGTQWAEPMPLALPKLTRMSVGWDAACGVTEEGNVECWGALMWSRAFSSLTSGVGICRLLPKENGFGAETLTERVPVLSIALGPNSTAWGAPAGATARTLPAPAAFAWLLGKDGSLRVHERALPNLPRVSEVAIGGEVAGGVRDGLASDLGMVPHLHACALLADGRAACWGDNRFGQAPPMLSFASPAKELAVGPDHNCTRLADGSVACWGADPDISESPNECPAHCDYDHCSVAPRAVRDLQDVTRIRAAPIAPPFNCAVLGSSQLYCWGTGYGFESALHEPVNAPACDPPAPGL